MEFKLHISNARALRARYSLAETWSRRKRKRPSHAVLQQLAEQALLPHGLMADHDATGG